MSNNQHDGNWFDNVRVIGDYTSPEELAYLQSFVNEESPMRGGLEMLQRWKEKKMYMTTQHSIGYVSQSTRKDGESNIYSMQSAKTITADKELIGIPLKVSLDQLMIEEYPGSGEHKILIDFYAENLQGDKQEGYHFSQLFRGRDGQSAGVHGYPVFMGIVAGQNGLAMKLFTVNVGNKSDDQLLGFLESDIFKSGLTLVETAYPPAAMVSGMMYNITQQIIGRHKNVPVQDVYIGMGFDSTPSTIKLREGTYVIVQSADSIDWNDWVFDANRSEIRSQEDNTSLKRNYIIISVQPIQRQ